MKLTSEIRKLMELWYKGEKPYLKSQIVLFEKKGNIIRIAMS